jgi:hypothetical protein
MIESYRIYRIDNGFLLSTEGDEETITAFTDDNSKETECVINLLHSLGGELLNFYAPPGTRLEIKAYNKYENEGVTAQPEA